MDWRNGSDEPPRIDEHNEPAAAWLVLLFWFVIILAGFLAMTYLP